MSEPDITEIVARAICDRNPDAATRLQYSERVQPGYAGGPTHLTRETDEMPVWKLYEARARACLTALDAAGFVVVPKEPTEKMIDAGAETTWEPSSERPYIGYSTMRAAYTAMLAAKDE